MAIYNPRFDPLTNFIAVYPSGGWDYAEDACQPRYWLVPTNGLSILELDTYAAGVALGLRLGRLAASVFESPQDDGAARRDRTSL